MIPNDAGDDLLVQIRLLGGDQCSNGKNPQCVGYGKGSFRGILSSCEGKRVRSPLHQGPEALPLPSIADIHQ